MVRQTSLPPLEQSRYASQSSRRRPCGDRRHSSQSPQVAASFPSGREAVPATGSKQAASASMVWQTQRPPLAHTRSMGASSLRRPGKVHIHCAHSPQVFGCIIGPPEAKVGRDKICTHHARIALFYRHGDHLLRARPGRRGIFVGFPWVTGSCNREIAAKRLVAGLDGKACFSSSRAFGNPPRHIRSACRRRHRPKSGPLSTNGAEFSINGLCARGRSVYWLQAAFHRKILAGPAAFRQARLRFDHITQPGGKT